MITYQVDLAPARTRMAWHLIDIVVPKLGDQGTLIETTAGARISEEPARIQPEITLVASL